ncbi:hypothetical protein GGR56DRAFT_618244 [Xylariaceae sp. FL0804]|nr:hypothetical protein GGR56DRAFT_618244 [Xylariaceae sp. FL0804]
MRAKKKKSWDWDCAPPPNVMPVLPCGGESGRTIPPLLYNFHFPRLFEVSSAPGSFYTLTYSTNQPSVNWDEARARIPTSLSDFPTLQLSEHQRPGRQTNHGVRTSTTPASRGHHPHHPRLLRRRCSAERADIHWFFLVVQWGLWRDRHLLGRGRLERAARHGRLCAPLPAAHGRRSAVPHQSHRAGQGHLGLRRLRLGWRRSDGPSRGEAVYLIRRHCPGDAAAGLHAGVARL